MEVAGRIGLRRAQIGALHAIGMHCTQSDSPGIVTMPTGTGKTLVLELACFQQRVERALVLTPGRLVRGQIVEGFSALTAARACGALVGLQGLPRVREIDSRIGGLEDWEALRGFDVVVATPSSISPGQGVVAPPADLFDIVLVDEAHHSPARTWRELLDAFPGRRRILFTATPYRRDGREIVGKFLYTYSVKEARDEGVFGDVEFRPVEPARDEDADEAIARAARDVLLADRAAGLDHRLMVRTDSKARADALKAVYERAAPEIRLQTVHSDHTLGFVKRTIQRLRAGELDGVVCVNMMGEGFDFPNLKVAAIHVPHRSLEVTLQFIGRFARTNAPNIGAAKFVAIPSQIRVEAERLYDDAAVWQDLVPNMAGARVDREVGVREAIARLRPVEVDEELQDLSFYGMQPDSHVKVYRCRGAVDLDAPPKLPADMELVGRWRGDADRSLILVTRSVERPRWTEADSLAGVRHDLFVLYHDEESNLLFVNASQKHASLYERLVEGFVEDGARILPLSVISRVLRDLDSPEFFNVGMRNRVRGSSTESYRIVSGRRAQNAIRKTDGKLFQRGHVAGRGTSGGRPATLGYSSSSKVWSSSSGSIPDLVEWCRTLARRLRTEGPVQTGSGLDVLSDGAVVAAIPAPVVCADWDASVYKKPPTARCRRPDGSTYDVPLIDVDVRTTRRDDDPNALDIVLSNAEAELALVYRLGPEGADLELVDGQDEEAILLVRGFKTSPLLDYLRSHPFRIYLSDLSVLQGEEHFGFDREGFEALETTQFEPLDWTGAGVSIQHEFPTVKDGIRRPALGVPSVHEHLRAELPKEWEVVFYDHGTGEVADFLCARLEVDRLRMALYHCKGAGGAAPGDRVDDVYEVAGQVVKSLCWINDEATLLDRLEHRRVKCGSEYLAGSSARLAQMVAERDARPVVYEMAVVQPGVSGGDCSARLQEVLGAASDYIIREGCEKLRIVCSP